MSRTTRCTALRTLAFAGAIVAAGLAAPAAGQAQGVTAERTLLNLVPATPSFATERPYSARAALTDPAIPINVEGARALLGRTPARDRQELDRGPAAVDSPVRAQVDGQRALLGQWTRAETRRTGVPRIATLAGDSGPDSRATQTEKEGVAP